MRADVVNKLARHPEAYKTSLAPLVLGKQICATHGIIHQIAPVAGVAMGT